MDSVTIEFQDLGGWRSTVQLPAGVSAQKILTEMQQASRQFNTDRIRAVDQDGRVVDRL